MNPYVSASNGSSGEPAPRLSERTDGPVWRSADFQRALHRAEQSRDKDDDPPPQATAPAALREPLSFGVDSEQAGKVDVIAGAPARNLAAAAVEPAPVTPGSPVDVAAFAAMLDRAWVAAFPDMAKAVQVRFLEQAWPMTGLQLVRLPDGALSVTVAASGQAVPQVNKALETLRRRLEARGLDILEVRLEADDATPVAGAGRGR